MSRWLGGITIGVALGAGAVLAGATEAPKPAGKPAPPAGAKAVDEKAVAFFETKVRPVLAQQCNACHNEKNVKGGLKLDTAAGFFKGGDAGPVVVPGHPEKSLLIDVISYTKDLKMPPQGKLKPQQIADLTEWVKMGAPWPGYAPAQVRETGKGGPLFSAEERKFWAYQPVKSPPVPAVKDRAWVASPVDAFILAKLEAKGLKPAPKADKRTLIRRVTFDLTGLPPTPEEVQAFMADTSPDAFAKVVDRLLASPAYGERWGRHWLDIARYADSNGLDENTAFANAWRYRDYVVRAFNEDKPYDRFIQEQVAGDLLPATGDEQADADKLTATGFLVLGPKVLAEPDKQKMVMDIVDEQIDTLGKSVMGLTLGCARCHDHKFDPIPTKDYYSLAGIFKSTRTMETLNTVAKAYERPLATKEAVQAREAHERAVQAKRDELNAGTWKANREVSTALLNELDRYLLVGLQAAVAPASEPGAPDLKRPGTVVLEAEKFARGDVKVTGEAQTFGYIESAGRSNAYTEYEFELPKSGEYELAIRYASGETRPVRVRLDGKLLKGDAAGKVTGGFSAPNQAWHGELVFTADAGKHVLRLEQAAGSLPHVDKIALVPAAEPAPAPAVPGARPRNRKPADLAKEHSLDAEVLRRSAAYLLAVKERKGDRVWEPWLLLSDLPQDRFAEEAGKLAAEWKASGKPATWNPKVAELFAGDAPKSLEEAAARYEKLFLQVNAAWLNTVEKARQRPTKLGNADMEELRQVLYGGKGAVGLDRIDRFYAAETGTAIKKLGEEVAALEKSAPAALPMVLAVEEAKEIGNVKVHIRGNHLALGDETPRQFLQIVAGEKQEPITGSRSGRLDLAQWLTRADNPLTPRVMVNRIWKHHFGEGIVRSPDNFGKLGERPTHPELLDYLASEFVKGGWSIKKMHRAMLLTSTYQMGTQYDAKQALADPENRLLWRFNRRRLEVEAIRDSILAVSGQLDTTMGGSLLKTPNFGYVTNDQSGNAAQYDSTRRAIYLPVIRNAVYDVFQVFDFVEPSFPNGQRANTTVAPQALFLLNGQFVTEQAEAFAKSLPAEGDDAARLKSAYLRAYGRSPEAAEVTAAEGYLRAYAERLAATEPDAEKRRLAAWKSLCQVLFASSEFVYVN